MAANPEIIRRYTNLASALHILRARSITLLAPDSWDDRNDRALMAAYKRKKKFRTVLALCFSQAAETYHHWKVFAPGSDGVFVEFKKQLLLETIKSPNIESKSIEYVSLANLRDDPPSLNSLPFSKRLAYQDEDEFRIVYTSKTEALDTKSLDITIEAVESIMVNPWLPEPLVETVRHVIKSVHGCEKLEVTQSKVTDSPAWRKFAATYA